MPKTRKLLLPKGKYISEITINANHLLLQYKKRRKIALCLVGIGARYWPYLRQTIHDAKQNFLPQHNVSLFIWSDANEDTKKEWEIAKKEIENEWKEYESASNEEKPTVLAKMGNRLVALMALFDKVPMVGVEENLNIFQQNKMFFRTDNVNRWLECHGPIGEREAVMVYEALLRIVNNLLDMHDVIMGQTSYSEVGFVEWPAPTLMRYHLFLQKEAELKKYDYIFYLDADSKILTKISDEILGEGLTAAEHPMYALRKNYVPPYEPNKESTAYIHRLGSVIEEDGRKRFKPYYVAGGLQGGKKRHFIKAMKTMKRNIDKDFNNNYTAIWNDESHWNKYLWNYKGALKVLSPEYVYPDSLISQYYEPLWGKKYDPKILTLTKPWQVSSEGGEILREMISKKS